MNHRSLEYRFLLAALIPAMTGVLVLSTLQGLKRLDSLEQGATKHARGTATQVLWRAHTELSGDRSSDLARLARSTVTMDGSIARVRIVDTRGNPLAEHPPDGSDDFIGVADSADLAGGQSGQSLEEAAGNTGPDEIGGIDRVEVAMDPSSIRHDRRAAIIDSTILAAVALALSGFLVVVLVRLAMRPLHRLAGIAEQIATGESMPIVTSPARGIEHPKSGTASRVMAGGQPPLHPSRSPESRLEAATHAFQQALRELQERNEELEDARRAAEAASEFKSRFLANISHEIRTPMNSILGFAELLRARELDPVHADYVETIHQSARSLLSLLNGILDLSKIESGHMTLDPVDVDINHVLAEIFRLLAPGAFHKGVELIMVPVEPGHARIHADPVRLKQVLLNFTSNAVKFTDEGYVLVSTRSRETTDGFVCLTIRIEDTGCGISPECRNHLFEAFAQGHPQRDASARLGTGLGLHIASELIFLMNGDVEFDSEPGKGSTFEVSLRLGQSVQGGPPRSHGLPRPGRVLLVEPDPVIRGMLARIFRVAGAACKPVDSAGGAARVAEPTDIVIVHVPARAAIAGEIPGVHWALARMRATVIAYSHAHDRETREHIAAAGYHGLLVKTADPETLRQDLERLAPVQDTAMWTDSTAVTDHPVPTVSLRSALVVDDHPVNRKLLTTYLEGICTHVTHAEHGIEAIRLASETRFDIILLDLHMPDQHGFEVTNRIRSNDGPNRRTPIVAITADSLAVQDSRLLEADIDEILIKPISRTDLLRTIASLQELSGSGLAETDAETDSGPPRTAVTEELRAMLHDSLPESRDAIRAALEQQNTATLHAAAHRLHGAVAYCDLPALRQAVEQVERGARDTRNWPELSELTRELLRIIDAMLDTSAD